MVRVRLYGSRETRVRWLCRHIRISPLISLTISTQRSPTCHVKTVHQLEGNGRPIGRRSQYVQAHRSRLQLPCWPQRCQNVSWQLWGPWSRWATPLFGPSTFVWECMGLQMFLHRNPVRRLPAPVLAFILQKTFHALDYLHIECQIIHTGLLEHQNDTPIPESRFASPFCWPQSSNRYLSG